MLQLFHTLLSKGQTCRQPRVCKKYISYFRSYLNCTHGWLHSPIDTRHVYEYCTFINVICGFFQLYYLNSTQWVLFFVFLFFWLHFEVNQLWHRYVEIIIREKKQPYWLFVSVIGFKIKHAYKVKRNRSKKSARHPTLGLSHSTTRSVWDTIVRGQTTHQILTRCLIFSL